jgi:hypothetical protein
MRIPVASEQDAFRWVFAIAIVIGLGVALGALVEPVYGALPVAGAVIGVIVWELGSRDPEAQSPLHGVAAGSETAGRHGVLVIANETVGGRELREELLARLERAPEVRVVCPNPAVARALHRLRTSTMSWRRRAAASTRRWRGLPTTTCARAGA